MRKRAPGARHTRVDKPIGPAPVGAPPDRDAHYHSVIANAVEFTATRFLGRGRYDTRRGATIDEAREHAKAMGVDRTMIYAVDHLGRQVLVEAGGRKVDP